MNQTLKFQVLYKVTNTLNMQNQNTFRSHNSNKYVTPRKSTVKKKKINLNVDEFEQTTADLYNYHKQWKISDFQILKQMGRGKFGYVYAAKQKLTDYVVAIKKMSKKQLKQNDFQQQVKRQIIIQASLSHPNILRLYGYFWDTENVYLILQYAPGGQLFNMLQKNRRLPEDQVSVIIRQVCEGLLYLHDNNIIHRDIKPQNILISGENIKIGDFGWSIHSQARRQTLCGTLDYLAPEIVKGQTHDHTIDVWQVGILAYELSTGHPPFQTGSNQQTYERIVSEDVLFPTYISQQLRQFVRKILQKNPNKRMQCSQILREPFILKYLTLSPNFNDTHK